MNNYMRKITNDNYKEFDLACLQRLGLDGGGKYNKNNFFQQLPDNVNISTLIIKIKRYRVDIHSKSFTNEEGEIAQIPTCTDDRLRLFLNPDRFFPKSKTYELTAAVERRLNSVISKLSLVEDEAALNRIKKSLSNLLTQKIKNIIDTKPGSVALALLKFDQELMKRLDYISRHPSSRLLTIPSHIE